MTNKSNTKIISKKRYKELEDLSEKIFFDTQEFVNAAYKILSMDGLSELEKIPVAMLIGKKFGEFGERKRIYNKCMNESDQKIHPNALIEDDEEIEEEPPSKAQKKIEKIKTENLYQ